MPFRIIPAGLQNLPRIFRGLRAPGAFNTDLSAIKDIKYLIGLMPSSEQRLSTSSIIHNPGSLTTPWEMGQPV
jgi:hypothetical protein